MKNIIARTIETTVKKIGIIIAVAAGFIAASIINNIACINAPTSFDAYTNELLIYQHLLVFFLLNGVVLITTCCSNSSGLIANEVHEGTLRLLLAKPNSRSSVLSAKIIGNIVGIATLGLLSLLSYFSFVAILGNMDGNAYAKLLSYLPAYIGYGVVIGLFFTGVTTLLSCIFKRKIAALLPMLAIMIVIVAVFPIFRLVSELSGNSLPTFIQFVDFNSHFGQILKVFVGKISGNQSQLMIISYLTNIFTTKYIDPDVCHASYGDTIVYETYLINPFVIVAIYIAISLLCYYICYVIMKKKDI